VSSVFGVQPFAMLRAAIELFPRYFLVISSLFFAAFLIVFLIHYSLSQAGKVHGRVSNALAQNGES
jgi:hypothetical protein